MGVTPVGRVRITTLTRARQVFLSTLTTLRNRLPESTSNTIRARLRRQANRLIDKINEGQTITARDLGQLESLIVEYRRTQNETQENRTIFNAIKDVVEAIKNFKKAKGISEREQARPVVAQTRPAPANDNATPLNSRDATMRSQIINGENGLEININLHELNINFTLPLSRALELAGRQNVTAEELTRAIPVERTRESSTTAADLLARIILNFVIDKLVKEVLRASQQVGEVTREAMDKIVKELNSELTRTVAEVRAKANAEVRKDKDVDALIAERAQERTVVYDRQANSVRLNLSTRMKQSELVNTARELVNSRPAEILPLLTRTATRAITTNLANRAEVISFVSELFSPTSTKWATEPVLVELIRSLLTEPRNIVQHQFAIAKTILSSVPQTALPVMLAEHARVVKSNPKAAQALGQVISEVAKPFVQNLLTEAKTQQAVAGKAVEFNLKTKDQAKQFIQVSKLVASANLAKMPADKVTLKSARAFLEYVAKTQQVLRLIGPKQAKAAQTKANKPAPKPNYFSKGSKLAPRRKQAAPKARTVRSRKALKELIRLQDEARLALPKELYDIIGTHYAGLAGLSGLKDSLITAPLQAQQQSQESSRNSHLRRVLQVMEAKMNRVAPRVARSTAVQSIVASIKASSILFGIIISRVRAEEKKIAALLKALRSKGYMKALVEAIDEGSTDLVVDFIANLVVQAGSIANHGEMTQEAVAQAIENIEQQALAA